MYHTVLPNKYRLLVLFTMVVPPVLSSLTMTKEQKHHHSFICQGELTLGAMMSVHKSKEGEACGISLRDAGIVQSVEALTYAVESINRDPDILPGVQLGYAILDDCHSHSTTLSQALSFISDRRGGPSTTSTTLEQCCENIHPHPVRRQNRKQEIERCCYSSSCSNISQLPVSSSDPDAAFLDRPYYDVVGVIGSDTSPISTTLATLLGPLKIPQISHQSTADTLSNKKKFPYFLRMIPPDHIQVRSLLTL